MVKEGADLVRDARGNVAAGEGVLGSAELSITDPRLTHTHGQGQLVHGKGIAANRKEQRVVPTGDIKMGPTTKVAKLVYPLGRETKGPTAIGAQQVYPLGTTSKGEKGMRHYQVATKSCNGLVMATKPRSIFPISKTAYGAKGEEQLPVDDESLQKRNGDESATKLKAPAKPNLDPEHVCNSDGHKLPTRAPVSMVKRSGMASPDVILPNSKPNFQDGLWGKRGGATP